MRLILLSVLFLLVTGITSLAEDKFDYIVVGGGTAGCVVAARLSENPKNKVLLLEAGNEPSKRTNTVALAPMVVASPETWQYHANSESSNTDYKKRQFWPRGKMLGGTSSLNGAIFIRANRLDFDSWVKQGAKGWSWEDVLPFYKKLENYTIPVKDPSLHSTSGPIPITTSGDQDPMISSFISASKSILGLNYRDINSGIQTGVSLTPLNLDGKIRRTSFTNYLSPVKDRSNLKIELKAFVEKIIFDDNKVAVAVVYSQKGKTKTVHVNKEVILCAGTINTPQLLMLSGVGPKEHLSSLGIKVVSNLPVGRNMKDHFGVVDIHKMSFNNINDVLFFGSATAFFSSKHNKNVALDDIQVMFFAFSLFYISVTLLSKAESVGYIELKSTNPHQAPKINPMHLDKVADLDAFVDGLQKASKVFKEMKLPEAVPVRCKRFHRDSLDFWKCWAKNNGNTFFHPVGTCKMGDERSPNSVVDSKLKVIGVKNVRIADASVFPDQISGNPVATILMIAERLAHFVQNNQ